MIFTQGPNYRSLQNCANWQFIGNPGANAYTFIDSLVYAGYELWCLLI